MALLCSVVTWAQPTAEEKANATSVTSGANTIVSNTWYKYESTATGKVLLTISGYYYPTFYDNDNEMKVENFDPSIINGTDDGGTKLGFNVESGHTYYFKALDAHFQNGQTELTLTLTFTPAGEGGGSTPSHTHSGNGTWYKDGTSHWHQCTADGCTLTGLKKYDEANHSGNPCTVCGYETATHPIDGKAYAIESNNWFSGDYWHENSQNTNITLTSNPTVFQFIKSNDKWKLKSTSTNYYVTYERWNCVTNSSALEFTIAEPSTGDYTFYQTECYYNSGKHAGYVRPEGEYDSRLMLDKSDYKTYSLIPYVKVTYKYVTTAGGDAVCENTSVYLKEGDSYPTPTPSSDYENPTVPEGTVSEADALLVEKTVEILVTAHVHTYSSDWSTSDTHHWHAANCGHSATTDYAAHTWGENDKCTVCQHNHPMDGSAAKFAKTLNAGSNSYNSQSSSDPATWYKMTLTAGSMELTSNYYTFTGELYASDAQTLIASVSSQKSFLAGITSPGTYYLKYTQGGGGWMTLTNIVPDGSSIEKAYPLTLGTAFTMPSHSNSSDLDWYVAVLEAGTEYNVGTANDATIYNWGTQGTDATYAGYKDNNYTFTPSTSGKYYFKIGYYTGENTVTLKYPVYYTVSISSNNTTMGTVDFYSGCTGNVIEGGQAFVYASVSNENDYYFVGWFEGENKVWESTYYSFPVNANRTLVAKFAAKASATMTITEAAGWATFCAPFEVIVPSNVKAYTAQIEDNVVKLTEVSYYISAGKPVVLKAEEGLEYTEGVFTYTSKGKPTVTECSDDYSLKGNLGAEMDAPTNSYVLQNQIGAGENGLGWYIVNNTGIKVKPNRCYIQVTSEAKTYGFYPMVEDDATAINAAILGTERNGKFIENGRVVIVKNGKKFNAAGQLMK